MVSVNIYDTLYASSILERAGKNQGCCKVALCTPAAHFYFRRMREKWHPPMSA